MEFCKNLHIVSKDFKQYDIYTDGNEKQQNIQVIHWSILKRERLSLWIK